MAEDTGESLTGARGTETRWRVGSIKDGRESPTRDIWRYEVCLCIVGYRRIFLEGTASQLLCQSLQIEN